jgi:hypothetical protein
MAHILITLPQQAITLWKTLGSWGGACNAERVPRCALQGRASNHAVCFFCIVSPVQITSLASQKLGELLHTRMQNPRHLDAGHCSHMRCFRLALLMIRGPSHAQYSAETGIEFEPAAGIWRPWQTHLVLVHAKVIAVRLLVPSALLRLHSLASLVRPCAAWLLKSVPWPGILRRLWVRHALVPLLMCAAGSDPETLHLRGRLSLLVFIHLAMQGLQ